MVCCVQGQVKSIVVCPGGIVVVVHVVVCLDIVCFARSPSVTRLRAGVRTVVDIPFMGNSNLLYRMASDWLMLPKTDKYETEWTD